MILYILLPCFNAEATIGRAIESVLPQLSEEIKLLIINDWSSDMSEDCIFSYMKSSKYIEYIKQKNKWICRALWFWIDYLLNKELWTECFVARLDSDDEYTSTGAIDLLNCIKKTWWKYNCYIAWILDNKKNQLTKFYKQWYIKNSMINRNIASYVDSVCSIIKLSVYQNKKYSYNNIPARAGDWIPSMRIQRDFGFYLTNVFFYKVHLIPNSLSRRLITKDYAKVALETNLILLNEFLLNDVDINKTDIWNKCLIISRYYAVIGKYKLAYYYLKLGIKNNPKNILYIWVALTCFLPNGYKIVNFFVEKFLFQKNKDLW